MDHKRRVPRRKGVLGWVGKYRINDGPQSWCKCEVVDVSRLGIKIEVLPLDNGETDLVGRQITIEVNMPLGALESVQLVGEIRSVLPNPSGNVRLGIEFGGLSDSQRALLDTLEWVLPVAW